MLGLPANTATTPEAGTLSAIAQRGSITPEALRHGILQPTGTARGRYLLAGELISTAPGRPYRVCSACIARDLQNGDEFSKEAAAYERRHWLMANYEICHLHGLPIIELHSKPTDFAEAIRQNMGKFAALPGVTSGWSIWHEVAARLSAGLAKCRFLDKTPVLEAIETCTIIGSIDLFEPTTFYKVLVPSDKRLAVNRGFELCQQGPDAIACVLDDAIQLVQLRRGHGLTNVFGRLIGFLSGQGKQGGYSALREQMVAAAHRHHLYNRSTTTLLGL